jgi:hypothetical protein
MSHRLIPLLSLAILVITSTQPSPVYSSQESPLPISGSLVYRLNTEGDEWILMDPNQAEVRPPAPLTSYQGEVIDDQSEPVLADRPPAEVDLELGLGKARESGPQAVLAFVAEQSNPDLPLLQSAAADAQRELGATGNPQPGVIMAPRVSINSSPCAYETIQAAINAAVNGNTIRVAAGSYTEAIDIVAKTITIEGGYDSTCSTLNPSAITELDATGIGGSVVDVTSGTVLTLNNLQLTGGNDFGGGVDLLGASRVTLNNTDIFGNNGTSGAGVYIGVSSVVTYTSDTDIYNNIASSDGGGAIVYGSLYGFDTNSDIYSNSAVNGGGIAVLNGIVRLNNTDVVANIASNFGGGIYASNSSVTLSNSVFVGETAPCCQSAAAGGGIYASGGQVSLEGAATSVLNNTASGDGGGIYLINNASLNVSGGSLGYDTTTNAGNDAVLGAGMFVVGSKVDFSGRIVNNIATNSGAGVYATNSTLTVNHATIGGRNANQHNHIGATGYNGAGLYLINNTRASLDDTNIISNTLSNPATGYGGGIYVREGSTITLTNSTIQEHMLPSATDGRGAGLYIYDATVTMSNTQVISNTTNNLGAGARLFGTSTLNILDGSAFINNKSLGGVGGAVAATNTPTIRVKDGIIKSNTARDDGGAFYLDAGTLDFEGWWDVRFNLAGGNGGAVAVAGTGDVDFRATAGPSVSLLAVNHANGNGGALYIGNTDTVTLYATSGYPILLNTNSAINDGGAVYSTSGAFFDVYGMVQATSNTAGGNGGVFYLDGGSRLWLDDYFDQPVQIWVNSADNGGAIYALNSPRIECDGVEFGGSNNGNKATAGSGGAVYLSGSTLIASNCLFRNNQAQAGNGGAIAAYNSSARIEAQYPTLTTSWREPDFRTYGNAGSQAVNATACDPLTRQCSTLYLNTAAGSASNGYGGAIYSNSSDLIVDRTFLHRNTAQRGGAIYQEGTLATGVISTTLVYSNTSLQSFGAGIRMAGGEMRIHDSTLANNMGGAGYSPSPALSYLYNTIIWGNSVAAYGALTEAVCNIDQGGTAGPALDPLFIAPGAGENYQLSLLSPAIDACSSGLHVDLHNIKRPQGGNYDMGAYEVMIRKVYLPITRR